MVDTFRGTMFADIFHLKSVPDIVAGFALTIVGGVIGYFTDMINANSNAFAAIALLVFADFAAGDFRLTGGSPCANAGTNQSWMAEAVDLDGRPRINRFFRRTDMGCYEYVPCGILINLR